MNKLTSTILCLTICSLSLLAQDVRPAKQPDIDFHNKIIQAFQGAMPVDFMGWDFAIPLSNSALLTDENSIPYCEGTTCFRSHEMSATYDGTMVKSQENLAIQQEIQSLNSSSPDYMKRLSLAMNKVENNANLRIYFCINCDEVGMLKYCKPQGYQKLPPPSGWSTYYVSAGAVSCVSDDEDIEKMVDVSILSMGMAPTVKEDKESMPIEGKLLYTLNRSLLTSYQVQNVVLRIEGSKDKAAELIKMIDASLFAKLMK